VVADSTFTLYLLHLPMITLFSVWNGHPADKHFAEIAVPVVIITLCVLLSRVFERLKLWMRKSMLHFWAGSRPVVAVGTGEVP
jgi:peptidoglycan/LPS O-acetylase OafA/YrhL